MAWLGELWRRLAALLTRRQFDVDLEEEMRLHIELRAEQQTQAGAASDEAGFAAQRRFGNTRVLKEASRDVWGWRWLETLLQDLHYGLRMIHRSPAFTTAAVLSLALGIGANTAIFTLINALLLRMLPVHEPQQLVWMGYSNLQTKNGHSFPYPFYREVRDQNLVFSGLLCYTNMSAALNISGSSERVAGELVSGNYFDVLGVRPYLGRLFTQEDDRVPGAERVVVLSYGFWTGRFGADPTIVGKVIHLNTVPMTVIGVSPPRFGDLDTGHSVDLRVPMMMQAEMWAARSFLESRGDWWLSVVGRLRPGITRRQGEGAVQPILMAYLRTAEGAPSTDYQRRLFASTQCQLSPMARGEQGIGGNFRQSLYVLMAVVGTVLLIACVNIANRLLARSAAREREIAIRLALGAGRRRVLRQMLTESLLLSGMGGAVGIGFAYWGSRVLISFMRGPRVSIDLAPDLRVLGFTFAVSILSGVLFGLAPALQSTRVRISPELKGGANLAGDARLPLGKRLISVQVALSVLLLTSAGLFARSLYNLRSMDTGFDRQNVLVLGLDPTLSGYKPERVKQFYREVVSRLKALPGVRGASYAWMGLIGHSGWASGINVEGYTSEEGDRGPDRNAVGSGYFQTLGIPILAGRDFGPQDREDTQHVAVINEKFARFYFGNQNPLGRRIGPGGSEKKPDFVIVGVVKDGKYARLRAETRRFWYIPYEQLGRTEGQYLYVRSVGNAEKMISAIRRVIQEIDANVVIDEPKTLDVQIDEDLINDRMLASLSTFFSLLATALASIGLYGIMAYSVARRTHDIGIRMALGAERADVLRLVLRQALVLVAIGIAAGVPMTLALVRVLSSVLYRLTPSDPLTISAAALLMFAVAAVASYLPARRASLVDPIVALHYE